MPATEDVLKEPEKYFHLPAIFINQCYYFCTQVGAICSDKHSFLVRLISSLPGGGFIAFEFDNSNVLFERFAFVKAAQLYDCVTDDACLKVI
jgi:hypothetical protein